MRKSCRSELRWHRSSISGQRLTFNDCFSRLRGSSPADRAAPRGPARCKLPALRELLATRGDASLTVATSPRTMGPLKAPERAERRVVRQGLFENGQHSLLWPPLRPYSGGSGHAFAGRQQGSQQRRGEHSPGVVGGFVLLSNGNGCPRKILHDGTRCSHRLPLAFDGEWNFRRAKAANRAQMSSADAPTQPPLPSFAARQVRRCPGLRWNAARPCLSNSPHPPATSPPRQWPHRERKTKRSRPRICVRAAAMRMPPPRAPAAALAAETPPALGR